MFYVYILYVYYDLAVPFTATQPPRPADLQPSRHPGNFLPTQGPQKRRKNTKTDSKTNEKMRQKFAPKFWLSALLDFFQVLYINILSISIYRSMLLFNY